MRNPFRIFSWLSTISPIDQFSVLFRELERLSSSPIRILDIGAGPATLWLKPEILAQSRNVEIEVTLFDANESTPKDLDVEGLAFQKIVGLAPADLTRIPTNSFDVVIAYDLIEHLPKHEGYELLYEINRICKSTSIIFTPNGHVWQPPASNNPFNKHISGWTAKELKRMGWKITRGHTGFKVQFGPYGILRNGLLPKWLARELAGIASFATYLFPSLAFSFTAVSRKKRVGFDVQEF